MLVIFDVQALLTNVRMNGALEAVKRVVYSISDHELTINKTGFMKLMPLCVRSGVFTLKRINTGSILVWL